MSRLAWFRLSSNYDELGQEYRVLQVEWCQLQPLHGTFGTSFGGNPQLCGLPLSTKCEHPLEPKLEVDEDRDEESGFTWRVVMLGYGCGTLPGFVIGYLMLSTGRPKWLNTIVDAGDHIIQTRRNKRRCVYIGK
ncbi:hypothetical protein L1887_09001 [Cichorium endivia]|nr:hypothetical protein L1887_09001 [Cichorium endivia]